LELIQKYKPKKLKKNIDEYIIDEIIVKTGFELIRLWVVIEPIDKEILSFDISKERNMFVVERFLCNVIKEYGKYLISTDRVVLGIHKHVDF
jgi:transposase-like protein